MNSEITRAVNVPRFPAKREKSQISVVTRMKYDSVLNVTLLRQWITLALWGKIP